ncbi:ABC transporter permease [Ornithinibacillus massiliensis]|uniref:ABC transporter permease n=1 Tax=Ornithinibacillus massiliensis TaxID=1944633 RepID=A0ABS5MEU5_9BACI|nr:ABC transporter permease [Ornithinibacillus massiliensis]MBS3680845.1 ABC transporter permease [Ornithinibacillus massiliensis]
MSFKSLIFRNLLKNMKNYYLYVFALVFSVSLYFAFVTLQFDPAMDAAEGSIKGEAAIKTASVLLIVIVTVFLVYANNLFIKRRGKEIGLFQLVGITKRNVFWIVGLESFALYFGSLALGIFLGFSSSKLIMMILLKTIGVDEVAQLQFSTEALTQTLIVFAAIYIVMMIFNGWYIKRQRILSLFHTTSTSEEKKHKVSFLEILVGIFGLSLIIVGYYLSTKLFDGQFIMINQMFIVMLVILGSVIIGTYFFYKGSVRFLFNLIRKKDNGYLSVNKVLSLSSIMFRMKSNSLLLTVITTVSALAIGLLSLSYISYYSAEKTAKETVVYDFSVPNEEHAEEFTTLLEESQIDYHQTTIKMVAANADLTNVVDTNLAEMNTMGDDGQIPVIIVSDHDVEGLDVKESEAAFIGVHSAIETFMSFHTGNMTVSGKTASYDLNLNKVMKDKFVIPTRVGDGGFPITVVDDKVFQQLSDDIDPEIMPEFTVSIGIDIDNKSDIVKANEIFQSSVGEWAGHESLLETFNNQKQNLGLIMFVVAFLGLTFLITSGCILYFKQMDEGEQEKSTYTILRKLGFTKTDLLNGIKIKQLFNFGIPLLVGLSHSYFAVKSGWFWFGTELWVPMIIVMVLYTLLYSIFGILSVVYYKRLIKEAL